MTNVCWIGSLVDQNHGALLRHPGRRAELPKIETQSRGVADVPLLGVYFKGKKKSDLKRGVENGRLLVFAAGQ